MAESHRLCVRYFIYFGVWLLLVGLLNKWSREQDQTGNPVLADRMSAISGPGLVFWGFAVSGAAVDWVMSLEPHWYSTIYGLLFIAIEALIALLVHAFHAADAFRFSADQGFGRAEPLQ